ncbi:isoleucine--tRNA ligase [Oceanithermus profundus]|uniref:isoleucine--tRNA ligase n=1 Tax=Oceanithermus profundus TaxID=187137 RepID=UPI0005A21B19|nr:isoleucine--tRNA ligase [Oceanithermus profundus]
MFQPVEDVHFPKLEEAVLEFWRTHRIVEKSFAANEGAEQYTFYEGPPTANGRPGVHHAQARSYKDLFPRFKLMQGYHVPRKAGWDTHGLPVELEVEKKLGLKHKREIEAYGIDRFNEACRASVFEYEGEWRKFTERIAFWVDLDDAYRTLDPSYIESVWWSLGELWKKDLLYRDYKVVPYCPRCGTPLSSHEVAQGYAEITDPSVYVRFPLKRPEAIGLEGASVSLLVWTTTPWTLPGNAAAALNPDFDYAAFRVGDEVLVLEEGLGRRILGEETEVVRRWKGRELEGLDYAPPFDFAKPDTRAWYTVLADYVTKVDGTGIVHQAPAFGAEDMEIARRYGLPVLRTVDDEGKLTVGPWKGTFFRDANKAIVRDLRDRGLLFKREDYLHNYPHCWRCKTPLMYYATETWFIKNTAYKDRLIELNEQINWVPEHIKHGRYGDWLKNLVDWALSRNRYWGTPLPIWVCDDCGKEELIGSFADLERRWGRPLPADFDPHRPHVDAIELTCEGCGGTMKRVPYVIDVWYDSGSMPFAQHHHPFENREVFARSFPADFISEGIDQTRGWFNSLHQLGTMLFDSVAFKNVICHGLMLDEAGLKMSKSRGNVVDPWSIISEFGADALRWYVYVSAPPEANRRFGPNLVRDVVRDYFLTLWNTYKFFVTYANLDRPDLTAPPPVAERPEMDRWLVARLQELVRQVTERLETYDPTGSARALRRFVVEELSQWYVRRNRRRFWKNEDAADREAAYATLWEALVTVTHLTAPFTPYLAEALYQNLVRSVREDAPESVHLARWPRAEAAFEDLELVRWMDAVIEVVDLARSARAKSGVKTRIPLPELLVTAPTAAARQGLEHFAAELADELNVKRVRVAGPDEALLSYRIKPNLPKLGPKYGRDLPKVRQALAAADPAAVARAVREGRAVELEGFTLEPDEVLVEALAPEGYVALEKEGYLAALDTRYDEALYLEGLARELVRALQQARKEMDLHVADRIRVGFEATGRFARALETHGERVAEETLALELTPGALPGAFETHIEDAEDGQVRFWIQRA